MDPLGVQAGDAPHVMDTPEFQDLLADHQNAESMALQYFTDFGGAVNGDQIISILSGQGLRLQLLDQISGERLVASHLNGKKPIRVRLMTDNPESFQNSDLEVRAKLLALPLKQDSQLLPSTETILLGSTAALRKTWNKATGQQDLLAAFQPLKIMGLSTTFRSLFKLEFRLYREMDNVWIEDTTVLPCYTGDIRVVSKYTSKNRPVRAFSYVEEPEPEGESREGAPKRTKREDQLPDEIILPATDSKNMVIVTDKAEISQLPDLLSTWKAELDRENRLYQKSVDLVERAGVLKTMLKDLDDLKYGVALLVITLTASVMKILRHDKSAHFWKQDGPYQAFSGCTDALFYGSMYCSLPVTNIEEVFSLKLRAVRAAIEFTKHCTGVPATLKTKWPILPALEQHYARTLQKIQSDQAYQSLRERSAVLAGPVVSRYEYGSGKDNSHDEPS